MHSHLYELEPHIQAVTNQRLGEALKAEQFRLARLGRPGRVDLVVSSLRATIGTMLISTGERLRQEPARSTAPARLKRQVVGSTS